MQYLLLVIFLLLITKDFRRGVVIYAPFKFFFYEGFQVGSVTFDIVVSVYVCLVYLFKYRNLSKDVDFPWKKSFILLTISGIIYSFHPSLYLGEMLRQIFCIYGYGFIFFCALNEKKIFNTFIKSCAIFAFLLAGNGLIQLFTDVNVLGKFHDQFYPAEFTDNNLLRFGNFSRIRSFCSHSISYGVECVVFSVLFIYLFFQEKKGFFKSFYYLVIALCLIGIITSGSRTPLVGIAVMLLPLFRSFGRIAPYQKITVTLVVVLFCALFGSYVLDMINSIINPESTNVEGSNTIGRLGQFAYSIYLVQNNWLLGYGNVNIMDMPNFDYSILFGAESIWMVTLLQKGLIGILAYIYFYVDVFKHLPKNNKRLFIFFVLGWLVIDSATSLMGINMFLPIMIITILYKIGNLQNIRQYDYAKI